MDKKKWYNYIIFDILSSSSKKTYIGSTVNPTRRFRQHNQEIKGGAKYTRGGKWTPYLVLYDMDHTKSSALSYEWHLKHASKKLLGSSYYKRKRGLEKFISTKISTGTGLKSTYTHILFVNSLYKKLTPLIYSDVIIIYLEPNQFTTLNLDNWVKLIQNVNLIKNSKFQIV